MKVFSAIRQAEKKRVPGKAGRVSAVSVAEPMGSLVLDCNWRVAHEVTVRFEATGPEAAIPEMRKRAQKAIAHEIFGELESDLRDLKFLLWEEDIYREKDDMICAKIESMMLKMRGETPDQSGVIK